MKAKEGTGDDKCFVLLQVEQVNHTYLNEEK